MIDMDDINDTIAELEAGKTTFSACERLAALYTVRANLPAARNYPAYYGASSPQSDFMDAVDGAPMDGVWRILDEHMEAIKVIAPKEYTAVCRKINALK